MDELIKLQEQLVEEHAKLHGQFNKQANLIVEKEKLKIQQQQNQLDEQKNY